ncbi:uncharacterized protein LOC121737441 [Aricia agestis]|uniref:uncharacterized protein LOC121737441 n=1 Tax=Aricia agestis TaxID=91739 RepID=UPI001C203F11|nr:uncharacterized protein LOC121737441 [Aricia agestis]
MDTFSTMSHLNAILRLVSLSCIVRDRSTLRHSWSFYKASFHVIFLTTFTILSMYFKFYSIHGLSSFSFKDAIQFVYLLGYVQYLSDLYFVYKYRQLYLDYINMYDYIDRILGINYISIIKSRVTKICLVFLIFDLCCSVFDYTSWIFFYGWLIPTLYSVEYVFYLFKNLSIADMAANMYQLEYRLRAIGDLLENDKTSTITVKSVHKDIKLTVDAFDHKAYKLDLAALNQDRPEVILGISRCYLLLLDQADCINTMYGLRILVTSIIILITFIMSLNIIIRLVLGSMRVENQIVKCLIIFSTIFRVFGSCFVVNCGIHRFERCYRESERIIRIIDHNLINRNISPSTHRALHDLRDLILSRPLNFHAHNFYRLDYTFLVSVSSATVTYTIILLQNMQ